MTHRLIFLNPPMEVEEEEHTQWLAGYARRDIAHWFGVAKTSMTSTSCLYPRIKSEEEEQEPATRYQKLIIMRTAKIVMTSTSYRYPPIEAKEESKGEDVGDVSRFILGQVREYLLLPSEK